MEMKTNIRKVTGSSCWLTDFVNTLFSAAASRFDTVPWQRILPSFKIAIFSQVASMSPTICAERITIRLSAASQSRLRKRILSSGSSPIVGSSTIRTFGSFRRTCAIQSLRFMLPDNAHIFLSQCRRGFRDNPLLLRPSWLDTWRNPAADRQQLCGFLLYFQSECRIL